MPAATSESPARFEATDFDPSRIGRFCDVVMKGGVTSGIVYPLTVCHLATKYLLKSVGGTSVGAIAAAIAVAAEFRRRQNFGSPAQAGAGYDALLKLPGFLAQDGVLLRLFAADGIARPLLRIALCFVGNNTFPKKAVNVVAALAVNFWFITLPLFLLSFWFVGRNETLDVGHWLPILGNVLVSALIGLVIALVFAAYRCVQILSHNAFGWCHAHDEARARRLDATLRSNPDITQLTAADTPPLFDWLHAFIEYTAGPGRTKPLTFYDIWRAPMPPWDQTSNCRESIDFRMVTTCVTLGRPFELPTDLAGRMQFYFTKEDLARYFPSAIVSHMTTIGGPVPNYTDARGTTYYALPALKDLPIVFATRMSMSFPVLFCAMRLYVQAPARPGTPVRMRPVWFTDGGLSSNFPINFFDSPLPRWPTFAIDLLGGGTSLTPGAVLDPTNVFMEHIVPAEQLAEWDSIPPGGLVGPILGFASGMIDTMRTWQDATLATLLKNRSRTVGIRLPEDEGGMNLTMTPPQVQDLIRRGDLAGAALVSQFASGQSDPIGWQDHRWIRYRTAMGAITRWLEGFHRANTPLPNQGAQVSYADMIPTFVAGTPTETDHPDIAQYLLRDASAASECLAATQALSALFDGHGVCGDHQAAAQAFQCSEPVPLADLVLRPPL